MGDGGCSGVRASVSGVVCRLCVRLVTGWGRTESWDGGTAVDTADDIAQVGAPSAKRIKTDGATVGSPSKRKRLEEEGLVLLESATDRMEDVDVIEID